MTAPAIALLVLIALAAFDLWVGVANDAVNFLNSAFGSKAASRRVIMTIAIAGVVFGALTSSGLMEVARRGVFDPAWFTDPTTGAVMLSAILAIYLGVMTADVLLLDLFNTFGLPTSTTVSNRFRARRSLHRGCALVVRVRPPRRLERHQHRPCPGDLHGDLPFRARRIRRCCSCDVAASTPVRARPGAFVQELRVDLDRCIVQRPFHTSSYTRDSVAPRSSTPTDLPASRSSLLVLLVASFAGAALLGVLFRNRWRQVLKAVILIATGGLAVSFAGNDLVNFIGPTVAAAQAVLVEGVDLSGRVPTPPWALVLAGRDHGSRAGDIQEGPPGHRHGDSAGRARRYGRATVQGALAEQPCGWRRLPGSAPGFSCWSRRASRADCPARTQPVPPLPDDPPYDLLRASVNLVVASLLISLGTAQGLPLSTTYITFMAAMGAAFGDRVWGADDAEARVAGILIVLGGWLLTGFIAASAAFVMASVIYLGGGLGILAACALVALGLRRLATVRRPAPTHG